MFTENIQDLDRFCSGWCASWGWSASDMTKRRPQAVQNIIITTIRVSIHPKITEIIYTWLEDLTIRVQCRKKTLAGFWLQKRCKKPITLKLTSEIQTITEYLWSIWNCRLQLHAPRFQEINSESSVKFPKVRTQDKWNKFKKIFISCLKPWEATWIGGEKMKGYTRIRISVNGVLIVSSHCEPVCGEWNGYHGKETSSFETLRYQARF